MGFVQTLAQCLNYNLRRWYELYVNVVWKKRWRWLSIVTAIIMVLQLVSGLLPAAANADPEVPIAEPLIDQPGGSTKWIVVGIKDWNNSNEEMQMKHLVGALCVFHRASGRALRVQASQIGHLDRI